MTEKKFWWMIFKSCHLAVTLPIPSEVHDRLRAYAAYAVNQLSKL